MCWVAGRVTELRRGALRSQRAGQAASLLFRSRINSSLLTAAYPRRQQVPPQSLFQLDAWTDLEKIWRQLVGCYGALRARSGTHAPLRTSILSLQRWLIYSKTGKREGHMISLSPSPDAEAQPCVSRTAHITEAPRFKSPSHSRTLSGGCCSSRLCHSAFPSGTTLRRSTHGRFLQKKREREKSAGHNWLRNLFYTPRDPSHTDPSSSGWTEEVYSHSDGRLRAQSGDGEEVRSNPGSAAAVRGAEGARTHGLQGRFLTTLQLNIVFLMLTFFSYLIKEHFMWTEVWYLSPKFSLRSQQISLCVLVEFVFLSKMFATIFTDHKEISWTLISQLGAEKIMVYFIFCYFYSISFDYSLNCWINKR